MRTAYGLDLAGYYGGKSALAMATFDRSAYTVVIYRRHIFNAAKEGWHSLLPSVKEEIELLKRLTPIYVDVPIDLQKLPLPPKPKFVWQLTKRPVDYAFNALPPVADKLGAPVARMLNLLANNSKALGKTLFETYPRASLFPMLGYIPKYKGQSAQRRCNRWTGNELAMALNKMNVTAANGITINDDHFDAAICALTGVVDKSWLLRGAGLNRMICECLVPRMSKADVTSLSPTGPKGYVLIRKPLSKLPLRIEMVDEFSHT